MKTKRGWLDLTMTPPLLTAMHNLDVMRLAPRYNATLAHAVHAALLHQTPHDGPILDFGAGCGTFTHALTARGWSVQPLEPEPAYAEAFAASPRPLLTSLAGTPDCAFAGAFSLNVLEHIPDDETALRALWRVLQPGATLYLYVPAHPLLYSAMDEAVGHVRRYEKAELLAKLDRAGFDVQQVGFADSLGYLASLILKAQGANPSARQVAFYDQYVFPWSRMLDRVLGHRIGKNIWVRATRGAQRP